MSNWEREDPTLVGPDCQCVVCLYLPTQTPNLPRLHDYEPPDDEMRWPAGTPGDETRW